MNTVVPPRSLSAETPGRGIASAVTDRLRGVQRAAAALRRGLPVVLDDGAGAGTLVVLAVETAEAEGLAALQTAAEHPPLLVIARPRAAALFGEGRTSGAVMPPDIGAQMCGYVVAPGALECKLMRSVADPTLDQPAAETMRTILQPAALPAGVGAAVQLAKIGQLLPTLLVAAGGKAAGGGSLRVDAAAIAEYPTTLTSDLRIVAEASVPLDAAPDARVIAFRPADGGVEHLAIVVGMPQERPAPLVRLHSACLTGDLFGSLRCDCGPQLRAALARMAAEGAGVLLYLAQEGRGIGLVNKLRAYTLQDRGQDTVDANLSLGWAADERSFAPAAVMLRQLGIGRVRLLTNNPAKLAALAACGIEVAGREAHVMAPNGINDVYLDAKTRRLGHLPEV